VARPKAVSSASRAGSMMTSNAAHAAFAESAPGLGAMTREFFGRDLLAARGGFALETVTV
jgi:hypothetical protein